MGGEKGGEGKEWEGGRRGMEKQELEWSGPDQVL